MEKARIYATGNENLKGDFNISYYIIEKDNNFLDWLGELLVEVLGIKNGGEIAKFVIKEKEDKNGDIAGQDVYLKKIDKMIDLHEHYEEGINRVDLFYGKSRIYVTFRKSREVRKKFAKFILKTREWVNIVNVPEIPLYVKRA